jgi:hypothetical protein
VQAYRWTESSVLHVVVCIIHRMQQPQAKTIPSPSFALLIPVLVLMRLIARTSPISMSTYSQLKYCISPRHRQYCTSTHPPRNLTSVVVSLTRLKLPVAKAWFCLVLILYIISCISRLYRFATPSYPTCRQSPCLFVLLVFVPLCLASRRFS